jgi:hypothetical protein
LYGPELREVLGSDGISIGGLGVFLLIAFATGHLLAALGNLIEAAYWRTRGGMPSSWVVGGNPRLLSPEQIAALEAAVSTRLCLAIRPLRDFDGRAWFPISRQIYADVERHGHAARVDTFNGIYGLNRGLCAAMLALTVGGVILQPARWPVSLGLAALAGIYLLRMHRFGVDYAREVYTQFLLLAANGAAAPKRAASRRAAAE